jgi:hypothetical protein
MKTVLPEASISRYQRVPQTARPGSGELPTIIPNT